jgi:hypothetical protein
VRKGHLSCLFVLFPLFLCATSARAETEAEPIRLAYRAPPGCPDEAAFVARVRARTTKVRLAWAGEAARAFTVAVEKTPAPLGRVIVENRDHSEATRQVQADTCADVVDALALVVALAVDPMAMSPTEAASPQAPPAAPSPSARQPAHLPGDGGVFGGVDVALASDVEPRIVVAGSPYVGWRATGARLFAPSLRLAFILATTGMIPLTGGTAAFTWTVGRLDGCPIAWPRGALRVAECMRLEAGALEAAAGTEVSGPRTVLRAWVAAGALARAEWSFFPPVFVDIEAGALVRVTQDRFYFSPGNTPAFDVPPLGATAGVGVGVLFF